MNNSLSKRDSLVIWHPYTQHQKMEEPISITKGEGALLFDEKGNTYIDAVSSWWVNLHGHGHPYIAENIYKQALVLEHVIFTHFTHEPAVKLAERLLSILPGKFSKVFYSDNGSTAVEVSLKMAIQFWKNKGQPGRNKILAFNNAYHGDTFGSMSVSARGLFTNSFKDFLFETIFIDTPRADNLEEIKSFIQSFNGQIAAFIYEPLLQAAGGMRMYEAKHLDELLSVIQAENILCIADEVLTGFGRTGTLFAGESLSHPADMICLSKGLTGGAMALGITACNQNIFNAFLSTDRTKTFYHGHSFTANPLACTAGLASLDLLEKTPCRDQIQWIRQQHEEFARNELSVTGMELLINIRTMGTILAFELNIGKHEYINEVSTIVMSKALMQGIYLRPLGNTVYVMPPYCITPEQLRKVYQFILSIPDFIRRN
ncbi:MAG TPA: adenosylmethionine--8-amino-7-oxononanoate transaminase [Puia sp.]|nr:adenosylmethionine--8-amino-7-oxononanoate transaminase [Puia sp.]